MTLSIDRWVHAGAYITYYARARLPGTTLTGVASILQTTVSGSGTLFKSEVKIGDWLRVNDPVLEGRAYEVLEVVSDTQLKIRENTGIGLRTITRLDVEIHEGTLRANAGDERALIRVYNADLEDAPQKRDISFQILLSARDQKRVRDTATKFRDLFRQGSVNAEMKPPFGFSAYGSLFIAWLRPEPPRFLGEMTGGTHAISLNFLLVGKD